MTSSGGSAALSAAFRRPIRPRRSPRCSSAAPQQGGGCLGGAEGTPLLDEGCCARSSGGRRRQGRAGSLSTIPAGQPPLRRGLSPDAAPAFFPDVRGRLRSAHVRSRWAWLLSRLATGCHACEPFSALGGSALGPQGGRAGGLRCVGLRGRQGFAGLRRGGLGLDERHTR
jgi:hypothetical protein